MLRTDSGAHPASYPMHTEGSFPRGKVLERQADHSPPTSAEVRKTWIYTPTLPIRLHGVVLSYLTWVTSTFNLSYELDSSGSVSDQWRALVNTAMNLWIA
jgi:hypothetical protein